MSAALPRPPAVELLEADRLRLTETALPPLPFAERLARDRVWDAAVRADPALFDGPVVVCAELEREGPRCIAVSWARTTYRHFALRRVPGATAWLPSLFVAVVQPTDDGRLLVGRMSAATAAPGRWQLPGGSVEPPDDHGPLDLPALRRNAVRELVEETGVDTPPDELGLWLLTRGENGNIGVLFRAPRRPADLLYARYADLVSAETARGRTPELDRIALVGSPEGMSGLGPTHVDYLRPVVRRWAGAELTPWA
ncbi:NUDIX domain-containing protein [Streptomyces sp. NPDC005202]|uniref:NUDIX hydrolase n=1 Tax=Streptomyces sp. NPDC005202 TaxID=3157021 RepID=UPI0033B2C9EA